MRPDAGTKAAAGPGPCRRRHISVSVHDNAGGRRLAPHGPAYRYRTHGFLRTIDTSQRFPASSWTPGMKWSAWPRTTPWPDCGAQGRASHMTALPASLRDTTLDGGRSDVRRRGGPRTRGFRLDTALATNHFGRGKAQSLWRMMATKHTEDPLHASSPVVWRFRSSHGRAR